MKFMIMTGVTIGSIVGGIIGSKFDGGFGLASIGLTAVGGIIGLWAGYKGGQFFNE